MIKRWFRKLYHKFLILTGQVVVTPIEETMIECFKCGKEGLIFSEIYVGKNDQLCKWCFHTIGPRHDNYVGHTN